MKKIYFLLFALISCMASFAQTVTNAGMESWRTNTSGSAPTETIQAPTGWFGADSLIIALGQSFLMDSMHPQLFREDAIVNGGSHSAKILTVYQDSTLGIFPGLLTNATESVNIFAILGGGSLSSAVSFSGGEPVTLKITTVSAYVEYLPGIDTTTHVMGGADTGSLTVEAHGIVHGSDSVLGRGFVAIPPCSSFTQITANIIYTDTVDSVGILRIFFSSGGGGRNLALDSSTLYVDDISMTGVAEPIQPDHTGIKIQAANDAVAVYPNPTNGMIYFSGPQNTTLTCRLYSVNGQVVVTQTFSGNNSLDVSSLPAGLYFYSIADGQGGIQQRGKISISGK
jgi:type IX secretion system substrate protein